jgi:hypothetical protein
VPTEAELTEQLTVLNAELDRRCARHAKVEPYFELCEGRSPVPQAIVQARVTQAYRHLMGMSETPWGKVIVNSKLDRLEVTGIDSESDAVNEAVWGWWQDEAMDLESKLAHSSSLLDSRSHALVWPRSRGPRKGTPYVALDDMTQMVVQYEEGSRRERVAAMRRWKDDDAWTFCTLYHPDAIYKFKRPKNSREWLRRDVEDESWPLKNPLGVVPVVELAVNRRLKPGGFAHARGEFEDVTGLMDRINLLTFLGLVVAVWMGFPLRGVIGDKIARDDDGKALPPFESRPDSVVQFENPDAKLVEFKAADRGNLSIFAELTELAASTETPRHYLPMDGGISNVSEPTIRAFEGGMHAKVNASHKPSLGEGWEEVLRLGGMMLPNKVELSPRAGLTWADHESRSLGERADAFQKLAGGESGLPWTAAAEIALNLSQDQITRFEASRSSGVIGQLLLEAQKPTVEEPAATNGAVAAS